MKNTTKTKPAAAANRVQAKSGDAATVGDKVWIRLPDGSIVAATLNGFSMWGFTGLVDGATFGRVITRWMIEQGRLAK